MVEFPKIPTRIQYSGDEAKARKLVGLGRKRFSDLTTALGFQGLETGFNTLKMHDGSEIKTTLSYGLSNIYIYVPLISVKGRQEQEEKDVPIYFYYRITHDGYIPDDSTLYEELIIDRLVIWEMLFDNSNTDFNPSEIDINYAGDFAPGTGNILLDVDIESNTVYPEDPTRTEEEELSQIALAEAYIAAIDSGELPEISDTMYTSGDLSDPTDAYRHCVDPADMSHDAVSIQINEAWEDANGFGYDYWHMIPKYPTGETEQTAWENRYRPDEGGNPAQDYLDNIWSGFLAVGSEDPYAVYYGTFICPTYPDNSYPDESSADWWAQCYICCEHDILRWEKTTIPPATYVGLFDASNYSGESQESGKTLIGGIFFTGIDDANQFPPFFGLTYNTLGNVTKIAIKEYQYDDWTTPPYDLDFAWRYTVLSLEFSTSDNIATKFNNLQTPLEDLSLVEITDVFGNQSGCNDFDCFDIGTTITSGFYASKSDSYGGEYSYWKHKYKEYFPCNPVPDGYDTPLGTQGINSIKKSSANYASTVEHDIKIPDPTKVASEQTNFASFISYFEVSTASKAGYIGPYGNYWHCNGENLWELTFANIPESYSQAQGLVIYIFAPEYFTTTSEANPEETIYWDIHTARYSEDEINPYRCLELEEYLIEIIAGLKEAHRASSTLPLYDGGDTDSIYTLEWYGYIQDYGFVNPI